MIEVETVDDTRVLRLAHGRASALDIELVTALSREIERAAEEHVRAIVLTGSGHIFCAGVDLFRVADGGADYVRRFLPAFTAMTFALFSAEMPVIVAANGHAIAGGAVLLAAADHCLMSEGEARAGFTELQVGVPYPPAALEVIRSGLPPRHVENIIYGADTYSCAEALRLGFVDELVASSRLMARALEVANHYARTPRAAFALTKRQMRDATLARMRDAEDRFAEEVTRQWCADEAHALIRAYLDRTVRKRGS